MKAEFSLLEHFHDLLRFWWVIALLAIAGGVFGYEISQSRTPVYESQAVFTVSLDFVKSGMLTDVEEDQAINAVTDLIGSSTVMGNVADSLKAQGLDFTNASLVSIVSVDRQGFQVAIHADHANAQTAYVIANTWATIAEQAVQNAIQAANNADELNKQLSELETCLQQETAIEPSFPPCQILDQTSLVTSLEQVNANYLEYKTDSKGIISAINVELTQKPLLAVSPRIFNRNYLVAAGAVLGFLGGILLVEGGFIRGWSKKNAKSE